MTPENAETPLLDAGVVLRSRVKDRADGDVEADTTVTLRPARRSQLFGDVTGLGAAKPKIEADWSGEKRTLAVSMTDDLTGARSARPRPGCTRTGQ